MALALGAKRGSEAGMRRGDYEAALKSPAVRELSKRVRCVLDPEIEKGTNTEEVPTRVSISLADGRTFIERVAHPRGSPHRRMTWDELSALFIDSVGDADVAFDASYAGVVCLRQFLCRFLNDAAAATANVDFGAELCVFIAHT